MFEEFKLELNRGMADVNKKVNTLARPDYCLLCGKKVSSLCNSHSIPEFILKEISENGYISNGFSLYSMKHSGFKDLLGLNEAQTFRLICRECDRTLFTNYENPDIFMKFDELDENKKKKILCEMAIKSHLSRIDLINKRSLRLKYPKYLCSDNEFDKVDDRPTLDDLDVFFQMGTIKELRKITKTNKSPFEVLYNVVLPYKTKIATQTLLNFTFDLEGRLIFDPHGFKPVSAPYFYLSILPYKETTRVLFYIGKKDKDQVSGLIEQFKNLSEEEKINFLFVSLIIFSEEFCMSPSFKEKLSQDKKITKLFKKVARDPYNMVEICNFHKYKNYLLKEFNE